MAATETDLPSIEAEPTKFGRSKLGGDNDE